VQRRKDKTNPNNWIWDTKKTRKVLYRLPQVLTATKEGKTIWITEGEKATHAAEAIGLVATNSSGGACKWKDEYSIYLKDADCVLLPDNDDPGRNHMKMVEKSLRGLAKSIRVLPLPGLPIKGDIYDFVKARSNLDIEVIKTEIMKLLEISSTQPEKPTEEFYYEKYTKDYLLKNSRKAWLSLSESQFKREMGHRGMRMRAKQFEHLSEADEFIIKIRDSNDVDYAAPLAGYQSGFYEMNGYRVLVTESTKIIPPVEGDWKTIEALLKGLLFDENYPQEHYLFGWLKIAYESLASGRRRPGQVLVMCGPHNCGKSLLQLLITQIIGGRSAKAFQFMTARTDFNGDLFPAEHLVIEDEPSDTDLRVRRSFGAQIKQIAGCDTQRCHDKHKRAITLTPFWRLSITLNNESENLMILPPIDDSIEDKMIMLRSYKNAMPMSTSTVEDRELFWNQLLSELPAFINFLTQWKIPDNLRGDRYGIVHFHHPVLLREIDALSPEFRLLSIIDKVLFENDLSMTWTGTAEDLEVKLTTEGSFQHETRKLLSWNNACGTYLGRLSKKYPERFIQNRTEKNRRWIIEPQIKKTDELHPDG
jgi:hypothetical protein